MDSALGGSLWLKRARVNLRARAGRGVRNVPRAAAQRAAAAQQPPRLQPAWQAPGGQQGHKPRDLRCSPGSPVVDELRVPPRRGRRGGLSAAAAAAAAEAWAELQQLAGGEAGQAGESILPVLT